MIYIWLILLIAVLSYREVLHLIQRGSWNDWDYWNVFWYTEHNSMWKDWDSFHFASGLAVLIICVIVLNPEPIYQIQIDAVSDAINDAVNIIVYWLAIHWLRNIFMHIIFKRKPEWKYLLPQIIYNLWNK